MHGVHIGTINDPLHHALSHLGKEEKIEKDPSCLEA
jgi:hypothetical protein